MPFTLDPVSLAIGLLAGLGIGALALLYLLGLGSSQVTAPAPTDTMLDLLP